MPLDYDLNRRDFLRLATLSAGAVLSPNVLIAQQQNQTPPIQTIVVPPGRWVDNNHGFITIAQAGRYRAEIVSAIEVTGRAKASVEEILEKTGADVCFNGSFFDEDGSTSGLYIRKGRLVKAISNKPNVGDGVLYIDGNGQINIVRVADFAKYRSQMAGAVQLNFLRYVDENGIQQTMYVPNYNKAKEPQNLIGLNEAGVVDVIFKKTNFSFGHNYMLSSHNCHTIAVLDGGPNAAARDVKGQSSLIKGEKENPVSNAIVLYQK